MVKQKARRISTGLFTFSGLNHSVLKPAAKSFHIFFLIQATN